MRLSWSHTGVSPTLVATIDFVAMRRVLVHANAPQGTYGPAERWFGCAVRFPIRVGTRPARASIAESCGHRTGVRGHEEETIAGRRPIRQCAADRVGIRARIAGGRVDVARRGAGGDATHGPDPARGRHRTSLPPRRNHTT